MNAESPSDTVNDLLHDLEDGREGFSKAAEAVKDPNLLFSHYASERARITEELLRFTPADSKKKSTIGDDVRQEVESQAARVLEAHNKVRELRDAVQAASS